MSLHVNLSFGNPRQAANIPRQSHAKTSKLSSKTSRPSWLGCDPSTKSCQSSRPRAAIIIHLRGQIRLLHSKSDENRPNKTSQTLLASLSIRLLVSVIRRTTLASANCHPQHSRRTSSRLTTGLNRCRVLMRRMNHFLSIWSHSIDPAVCSTPSQNHPSSSCDTGPEAIPPPGLSHRINLPVLRNASRASGPPANTFRRQQPPPLSPSGLGRTPSRLPNRIPRSANSSPSRAESLSPLRRTTKTSIIERSHRGAACRSRPVDHSRRPSLG